MRRNLSRGRRGLALVMVLLVLGLLAVVATGMLVTGQGALQTTVVGTESAKALYAAEAGAMEALVEVTNDGTWNGWSPSPKTMPNGPETYSANVFQPGDTAPNGVVVPAGLLYILATGTSRTGVVRQVGLMIRTGVGSLDYAVVARDTVVVDGGSRIDSMDPVAGTVLPDPASVATMATNPGSVTVNGGSQILGDAMAGPGAAGGAVQVTGGSAITGTIGTLTAPIPLDSVVLPADPSSLPAQSYSSGVVSTLAPGTYGDLVVSGGASLTLDPGEYVFNSITLNGGGQLGISDAVDIYVAGDVDVQVGSILNPTKIPTNFNIFVAGGPLSQVNVVSGGTGFYVLYAPDSDVVLDGAGTVFGNIIGRTLRVTSGSAVHYDPASGGSALSGGSTTSAIVTRQVF